MSDTTDKSSSSRKIPIKIKFVCDVCGKGFQYRCHLRHHSRIHTGEKPCKCDICGMSFRTPSNKSKHKKTHTDKKPFRCHICGRTFRSNSQLDVHVRIHTRKNTCRCNVCDMSFTSISNLRDHTCTWRHNEKPFKCGKCDKKFHSTEGLAKHMPSHEKYKPCTCSVCCNASNFHKHLQQSNLRDHTWRHEEKLFKCGKCDKNFHSTEGLAKHMPSHEKYKPCTCSVCCNASNFHKHLQQSNFVKHNGERHMCGKEMMNNTQMHIGHLETFNNETSNSQLLTPVRNAASYICHLCDTDFPTSTSLLEHIFGTCGQIVSVQRDGTL